MSEQVKIYYFHPNISILPLSIIKGDNLTGFYAQMENRASGWTVCTSNIIPRTVIFINISLKERKGLQPSLPRACNKLLFSQQHQIPVLSSVVSDKHVIVRQVSPSAEGFHGGGWIKV